MLARSHAWGSAKLRIDDCINIQPLRVRAHARCCKQQKQMQVPKYNFFFPKSGVHKGLTQGPPAYLEWLRLRAKQ